MRADVRALIGEIEAMTPADERHAASIAEVLDGLRRLAAPFDEQASPTHVTSSALVLGRRGVVLHRHKRLGLWLQPGGHIDRGESPPQTALREVLEETGLIAEHPPSGPYLIHVDAHDGGRGHRHLDLRYLVVAGSDDPRPAPGESPDARWFSVDDAIAHADPGLAGALRALQQGRYVVPLLPSR